MYDVWTVFSQRRMFIIIVHFRALLPLQEEMLHHVVITSCPPIALGSHESFPDCVVLPIQDISYRWNYIICNAWHLFFFFFHSAWCRKGHPFCGMYQYLICFYGYIIFHWNGYLIFIYWSISWCARDFFLLVLLLCTMLISSFLSRFYKKKHFISLLYMFSRGIIKLCGNYTFSFFCFFFP